VNENPDTGDVPQPPGLARRILVEPPMAVWHRIAALFHWFFGVASVIVGLALLATIPLAQLLSLGYLLEVSRRVAASGRWRDGCIGIDKAARIGSIVLGSWLILWPARIISEYWYHATLIAPGGERAGNLYRLLVVVTTITVVHLVWAWFRGGRLRDFLWPAPLRFVRQVFKRGTYGDARDRLWDFVVSLRLPYYFMLGLRGFLGAMAWLLVPILLCIGATTLPQGLNILSGLLGALLLTLVLLVLPFLQTQFACQQTWSAMFDWRRVRLLFQRAPIAFWFSLSITLLFAIPLYLLKLELLPREVLILPSVVFIVFSWPARLLCGWAVGRSERHEMPRIFISRWFARLAIVPTAAIYTLVVFLTPYTSWYGTWSLLEQHAFLVPVPFLGG